MCGLHKGHVLQPGDPAAGPASPKTAERVLAKAGGEEEPRVLHCTSDPGHRVPCVPRRSRDAEWKGGPAPLSSGCSPWPRAWGEEGRTWDRRPGAAQRPGKGGPSPSAADFASRGCPGLVLPEPPPGARPPAGPCACRHRRRRGPALTLAQHEQKQPVRTRPRPLPPWEARLHFPQGRGDVALTLECAGAGRKWGEAVPAAGSHNRSPRLGCGLPNPLRSARVPYLGCPKEAPP